MLEWTDEQKRVFFQNWHNQWIQPELDRRFGANGVPDDFRVRECLIMLPKQQHPIIKFNNEFGWSIKSPDLAGGIALEEVEFGKPIYLYELVKITEVLPPTVDRERVAFMYLYWDGFQYQLFVDFLVNQPDYDPDNEEFKFDGKHVARHLQNIINERVVLWAKRHIPQIREIGLWIATPLIPYPLSKIVERVDAGKPEEARQILTQHCNSEFITKKLVETWHPIEVFKIRQPAFNEALQTHMSGQYHASISTLISHVEGVMADWLHELMPSTDVKWRLESRIEQFEKALQAVPDFEYTYRVALESTIEFLREGENTATPFQAFKKWLDKIDPNFPARHAISHGKYVPEIYTEENSIKLFLLLDAICQFMMFYEVRVLGRDLGQNAAQNQ